MLPAEHGRWRPPRRWAWSVSSPGISGGYPPVSYYRAYASQVWLSPALKGFFLVTFI
jgi:hypothetical protein